MGFNHIEVAVIERVTKAHLTKHENTVSTVNASDPLIHKVDGIIVSPQLAAFCTEVRKINRHVKFGIGDWGSIASYAMEMYVYMDGHTYAMAKIGFADYALRSGGSNKYFISARMIRNEKFGDVREQYYMATADSLDRGVKNVKKYMRPYAPVEVAGMSFLDVRSKFSSVAQGVSSELYRARSGVLESGHIRNELFHMLDMGYEFLAEDFRENIAEWREKYNEDQVARGRALHAYYVNVRIHREEMVCDVIEVLDANKRTRLDANMPVTTYKMEDLPEGIAGNLAALSMVEDNHYVDGVGLRVDSSTFWVQR